MQRVDRFPSPLFDFDSCSTPKNTVQKAIFFAIHFTKSKKNSNNVLAILVPLHRSLANSLKADYV